ncbi:hypothetical protein PSH65_29430 [Pseudomonas sp. FP603]|uniref:Uncharacterized protein n=1 Tax=Pseudomonas wuhanensis TaxID=2954098 RepID=A0ABY9H0G4_9PSED|nr:MULTISPECIES: hypothetical protein [unclassified Pseudomonas]WLI15673.1 hypothetical protein PSH65_29430 [Pseudomonas sp. FP603]WLI21464.1 hypothetical protein PSH88_28055 [Pseudomonas sp. FP607]
MGCDRPTDPDDFAYWRQPRVQLQRLRPDHRGAR